MLGVGEAKLNKESIKDLDLDKEIDYENAYQFCLKLGTEIESGMWVNFNHEISREYNRKSLQLQTSLRDEDNTALRL